MDIQRDILLAQFTTLQIGGPADYFICVENTEDLIEAVTWGKNEDLPITIIGGGSNILVSDTGIRGLVIKNDIKGISYGKNNTVTVGAGVAFDDLVLDSIEKNLWGLENLSHIPGSVGATPIQNVGAYGVEIKDLIEWVEILDLETLKIKQLSRKDCQFLYRDSIFKHDEGKNLAVIKIMLQLTKDGEPKLSYKDLKERFDSKSAPSLFEIRNAIIDIRSKKFPDWKKVGTAGSFFKNPIIPNAEFMKLREKYPGIPGFEQENGSVKVPLGWILDKVCNVRGYREGNVGTYEGQALVLINYGGATEKEIKKFASHIESLVKKETGVVIKWEVTAVN